VGYSGRKLSSHFNITSIFLVNVKYVEVLLSCETFLDQERKETAQDGDSFMPEM
jgi:hypothetical protein